MIGDMAGEKMNCVRGLSAWSIRCRNGAGTYLVVPVRAVDAVASRTAAVLRHLQRLHLLLVLLLSMLLILRMLMLLNRRMLRLLLRLSLCMRLSLSLCARLQLCVENQLQRRHLRLDRDCGLLGLQERGELGLRESKDRLDGRRARAGRRGRVLRLLLCLVGVGRAGGRSLRVRRRVTRAGVRWHRTGVLRRRRVGEGRW